MIFRTEHPKPQFMRESWMNLNGEWQFETDNDNDGRERELFADGVRLFGSINVPFCRKPPVGGRVHRFHEFGVVQKELYA